MCSQAFHRIGFDALLISHEIKRPPNALIQSTLGNFAALTTELLARH